MKINLWRYGALLIGLCVMTPVGVRSEDNPSPPAVETVPSVEFRPPSRGAPATRLTGGSRGSGDTTITLDVLAPNETGLTTQEQPSLFWYQSKPAEAKFELTLLEENKIKPVLQVKFERSGKAGIQRIKLSEHGVKLSPNIEYQWVVALVIDPDNRSSDLVASGAIKRIEPSAALKAKIAGAKAAALPGIYAEAGIWHDALETLSDLIDAQPGDRALRQTRADLLAQVGLKTVASSEGALAKK